MKRLNGFLTKTLIICLQWTAVNLPMCFWRCFNFSSLFILTMRTLCSDYHTFYKQRIPSTGDRLYKMKTLLSNLTDLEITFAIDNGVLQNFPFIHWNLKSIVPLSNHSAKLRRAFSAIYRTSSKEGTNSYQTKNSEFRNDEVRWKPKDDEGHRWEQK